MLTLILAATVLNWTMPDGAIVTGESVIVNYTDKAVAACGTFREQDWVLVR